LVIKDNFCTKGVRTTASSKVLENYVPAYDATVVSRLKQSGAILLGKTNMDAWAHGSSTETSDFFTTRNPWDLTRLPGGSSGGSAAAVAANMTIVAIGSETAGSIRQPAAWCGVVGMKPTYGRVSRYGVIAMASSTDSPGIISKTVEDSALVLNVLAGQDEFDATSSPKHIPNYLDRLKSGIKGIKIGVPKEYFIKGIQKEVVENTYRSIKTFEGLRAKIEDLSLIHPKYSVAVYTILQRSEVSSNLARYDGIRFGNDRTYFGQEAKRRIMLGTYTLSAGYYEQYYAKAQKARTLICQDFEKAFRKVDLIIGPTSPCVALPIGVTKDSAMFGELQDILVEASSIAGLPGLNLCSGFSFNGLPTGIQIIGPQFSEELVLKTGYAYEQSTEWGKKKPELN
jgi:aspartyl-tRNA(Asn)/glutamyl-tRNA(Gln) amidotransferase subunit A